MSDEQDVGNCTKCGCMVQINPECLGDLTKPHPGMGRWVDFKYIRGEVCTHAEEGYKAALGRVAMLRRADFEYNHGSVYGYKSPEIETILTTLRNKGYDREVHEFERGQNVFDSYHKSIENLAQQHALTESLASVAKTRERQASETIARFAPQPRPWREITSDIVLACGEVARHGGTTTAPRPGGVQMMLRSIAGLTVVNVFPGAETPMAAFYWPRRDGIGLPFVDDGPVYPQPSDTVWLVDDNGCPRPWPEGV